MVYESACRFLGREPAWDPVAAYPVPGVTHLHVEARGRADEEVLAEVVSRVHPVARDDETLRRSLARRSSCTEGVARQADDVTSLELGREFDLQRHSYPARHEFRQTALRVAGGSANLVAMLRGLQFPVEVS